MGNLNQGIKEKLALIEYLRKETIVNRRFKETNPVHIAESIAKRYEDRIMKWGNNGAQPSEAVHNLFRQSGLLEKLKLQ